MKAGDKWNWAIATMAIMMLFFVANSYLLKAIGADKYRGAFVLIVFSMWAGIIHFVLLGLVSLFKRNSEPILGALLGLALFGGALITVMTIFITLCFVFSAITPDYKAESWLGIFTRFLFRLFSVLLFVGVPVLALAYAIWRKPKNNASQLSSPPLMSKEEALHILNRDDPRSGDALKALEFHAKNKRIFQPPPPN